MSDFSAVAPPKTLSGSYDTNSAFADAVQRARQIAAKIHSGGDAGTKRPLEDGQTDGVPEAKKLATTQDSIALQIASMQAQRAAGAAANATTVEEWKVPDKMVGLIIGRGGEQITRLQAESGCKVQMAADSGGLPERTCTLTGTRSAIEKAKDLMTQIISRGGPPLPMIDTNHVPDGHTIVEMAIPGPKVGLVIGKGGETIRNLQERAGVKMVLIQDGPQQTATEKPLRITGEPDKCEFAKQLVMDLITEKELESLQKTGLDGTNDYGSSAGGGAGGGNHEIMVPKQAVGVVIGKGGDMIKKIQQDSGAKVQFLNVKDEGPEDKVCIVSGTPEQIQSATNFINDLIQSVLVRDQQNIGRGRGRGRTDGPGLGAGRGRSDVPEVHYAVPANKCGIVIGKGGETVKSIIAQCGAYVTLSALPPPNPTEKIFIIKGQPQQIEHAKELINEKMGCVGTVVQTQNPASQTQQPFPPQFAQQPQQQPPQQPQQYQPPAAPPQQFAAPQGWTNPYQPWQTPGAPATDPNAAAWAAYYSQYYSQQAVQPVQPVQPPQPGQPAPAAAAVQPGVAPHGIPGQPEQNPAQPQPPTAATAAPAAPAAAVPAAAATGQPDYSAAWAEYYRSLGMFREAEMIENQARAQVQLTTMAMPQPGQPFPQPAAAATAPATAAAPVPAPQAAPQPGAPPGPVPPTSVPAPVPPAVSQPTPVAPAPAAPAPTPVPTGVPAPGQPQPFPGGAPQAPGQWPAAPGPYPQQFGQQQPNAFVGYNFPAYGQPPFSAAPAPAPQ